jgi:SPX domain protein involved in polyphosphate accumulation
MSPKSRWNDEDEHRFVKELEGELDKVYTFQKVKAQEIVQRIKAAEAEVNQVIEAADNRDRDGRVPPSEEDFEILEEDLSDIISDVHDLTKFTQLNYTGFTKIIKKHDVRETLYIHPSTHAKSPRRRLTHCRNKPNGSSNQSLQPA